MIGRDLEVHGELAERAMRAQPLQAIHARKREETTSALYSMTRELAASRGKQTLAAIIANHIAEVTDSIASVWTITGKGDPAMNASPSEAPTVTYPSVTCLRRNSSTSVAFSVSKTVSVRASSK